MDLMKVALVGGEAWLAYEFFLNPTAAPGASTGAPATPSIPSASTAPSAAASTPPPPVSAGTRAALIAAAAAANLSSVTADQWAYFYQQITGKPAIFGQPVYAPIMSALGITKSCPAVGSTAATCPWSVVSVDQFLAALQGAGLSGLGRRGARRVLLMPRNYVRPGSLMQ